MLYDSSYQGRETRPLAGAQKSAGSAATQSRPGPYVNNSQDWESRPLAGTQTGAGSADAHCAASELYHPITTPVSPVKRTETMRVPILMPLSQDNDYSEVPIDQNHSRYEMGTHLYRMH